MCCNEYFAPTELGRWSGSVVVYKHLVPLGPKTTADRIRYSHRKLFNVSFTKSANEFHPIFASLSVPTHRHWSQSAREWSLCK